MRLMASVLAPAQINVFTRSYAPKRHAMWSGVSQLALRGSTCTGWFSKKPAILVCPAATANDSGVLPQWSWASGSAAFLISKATAPSRPAAAALCNGIAPHLSCASTLPPNRMSLCNTSV
eukprot:CAMPEP_0204503274 /NCGR_PEP_ID=MMETSP0471-20130131/103068_1 /ASSEMBLY_ACC=CAM_ASM_000602 /TAXON_ID=2969 /ORGANISM="Oxyrrhis marina" /LENGTH=119 /DNA_ID=CAMNT_0051508075 /DNA_START=238 /DNA_END=597 /DNA_ORIENTATION=+